MRHIAGDPRYNALKTQNLKKATWKDWKPLRAKEELEERRTRVETPLGTDIICDLLPHGATFLLF
jgi:hypothetical protein